MKVTTETEYYPNDHAYQAGEVRNISYKTVEFCCEEMRHAFEYDYIQFGEFHSNLNTDKNVNIARCSPYPEGAVWEEKPIKFCPFCAEQVEIE